MSWYPLYEHACSGIQTLVAIEKGEFLGPTIILDKSTFQSLSFEEIVCLHNYYFVVVTPVLLIEILGDLTKPKQNESETIKKVKLLSLKIQHKNSCLTANHRTLIIESLLGNKIEMKRRPIILHSKSAISKDGNRGVICDETPEEKALHNWREGNFTEVEKNISLFWRASTTKKDKFENLKKQAKNNFHLLPKIKDLKTLYNIIEKVIGIPDNQTEILKVFISSLQLDHESIQKIFYRWEQNNSQTINEFAPYAYYCLKIQSSFLQGVIFDKFGTKSTNDVDLTYLFYLPFCNIFSSEDKFHKKIINFCLEKDQSFISGTDLKKDLNNLISEENELQTKRKKIPHNPNTYTYKFWEKHLGWSPDKEKFIAKMEDEEGKRVDQIIQAIKESKLLQANKDIKDTDIKFVQQKFKIMPDEFCFCGSGKKFKNCCSLKISEKIKHKKFEKERV